ncbi:MAG: hybrid sensor histidine kinase/response regulator [Magnetococcales bacterium]|nr:hybrid sensor histidine kinase/response regulator [Magnetococcales bacterium]MBF0321797.1 hybrid sensor histidine kinase/response regulator [Magnetococcales bacterium]
MECDTAIRSEKQAILVVDDVPANIKTLISILSGDYKILVATSGPSALETASSKPIDLILLDILMPGMDGFEVCRRLKADAATRSIPVVFITGLEEPESEKMGLEIGAVDYVTKPFNAAVVKARVGNHLYLQATLRQLARQNQALSEAEKIRGQVEQITRHDMKSPLNGIIGFTELLLAADDIAAEHKESLLIIRQDAYRALHMINLSLGLYRMEQGTYHLTPKEVDLIATMKNVRQDLDTLFCTFRVTSVVLLNTFPVGENDRFLVMGEEMLCYSVLANLVRNAVEASPMGGSVTLSMWEEESMNVVSIHNRGGVPEAIRDRFFDRGVTHGKKSGTGLGTYSAKLIVEAQGGNILLAPATGLDESTIQIRLPRASSAQKCAPHGPDLMMTTDPCGVHP